MKTKKLLLIIFFAFVTILISACKIENLKSNLMFKKLNNNYENTESINEVNEEILPFNYTVTYIGRVSFFHKTVVFNIDTYEKYVDFIQNTFKKYDNESFNNQEKSKLDVSEDFFDTYGLILYYQMEPSGSNKVNVKSLTLQKDYSLIINVEHYFPAVGTCDIAEHLYLIEYEKVEQDITTIEISYSNICETYNQYVLKKGSTLDEVKEFIEQQKDNIITVNLYFQFRIQIKPSLEWQSFEQINYEEIERYGINRLTGNMYVLKYYPGVIIDYCSIDDIDLDLINEIINTDDSITLYFSITYKSKK